MNRPKVLVFDDETKWGKNIENTIKSTCFVKRTTTTKLWNEFMQSTFWDAIIVDVQIMGSPQNGAHLAEKAILDYGITSPIIIISGNVNLDLIRNKYGKIFLDFVSKTDYVKKIPLSVKKAYTAVNDGSHLQDMLNKLAKKYRVYDDEIILEFVRKYSDMGPLLKIHQGVTIGELINSEYIYSKKTDHGRRGRAILEIIANQT